MLVIPFDISVEFSVIHYPNQISVAIEEEEMEEK